MILDDHHYCRRTHAIRRLAERYNIHISTSEYEQLALEAQHAPQIHGTNLVSLTIRGKVVYCSIQRGEISTFVSPEQAAWLISGLQRKKQIERPRGLSSLGDFLG